MSWPVSKLVSKVLASVVTPKTGYRTLFPKSDGWYDKNDSGVETKVSNVATTTIVGITGTLAQFNTAVTDADLARTDAANTFTGIQTMTSPALTTPTIVTATPASAGATGVTGTVVWDSGFIYVCTATNTWKKVAIATW